MVDLLNPISTGHFISEADLEGHPERLAKSFAPVNWERVLSLRDALDPDRLFHDAPAWGSANRESSGSSPGAQ
jgi:hypothetical protein